MMRAVALAARLDFTIDPQSLDAIRIHRHEIARSSAPRLLEEYYKILRAGASERTFRDLARLGLLEPISEELHRGAAESLWQSLARGRRLSAAVRLDAGRPDQCDSARQLDRAARADARRRPHGAVNGFQPVARPAGRRRRRRRVRNWVSCRWRGATSNACASCSRCSGGCTISRPTRAPSARSPTAASFAKRWPGWKFTEARPTAVEHWKALLAEEEPAEPASEASRSRWPTDAAADAGVAAASDRRPLGRRSTRRCDRSARHEPAQGSPPVPASHREHVVASLTVRYAVSSIVLYDVARPQAMSSLMIGHAGSISLALKLNFGLRGNP